MVWADDSDVTVATGNSRHYQPLLRIARRHRRKSSNLLFSTFFLASPSFWSRRTILPFPSPLSLSPFLLSLPLPSPFLSPAKLPDTTSRREWTAGPFSTAEKRSAKGWQKMAGSTKESWLPRQPRLIWPTLSPALPRASSSPRFSGRLGSSLLILPAIFKRGRTLVTCKNICDCVICRNFIYIHILIYIVYTCIIRRRRRYLKIASAINRAWIYILFLLTRWEYIIYAAAKHYGYTIGAICSVVDRVCKLHCPRGAGDGLPSSLPSFLCLRWRPGPHSAR